MTRPIRGESRVLDPGPPGNRVLRWICLGHAFRFRSGTRSRPCRGTASSDGLLHWLSEECSGRGLRRLGELLDDLLTERQAEQPERPMDPELEALLPF